MIEEIKGKFLVVITENDEILEHLASFGFPVNYKKKMACITRDTYRVFKVGEKYVLLNAENPDVVQVAGSLEELAIWVLGVYWGLNETASLICKGNVKADLYDGSPWFDKGWSGGWDGIAGGVA